MPLFSVLGASFDLCAGVDQSQVLQRVLGGKWGEPGQVRGSVHSLSLGFAPRSDGWRENAGKKSSRSICLPSVPCRGSLAAPLPVAGVV